MPMIYTRSNVRYFTVFFQQYILHKSKHILFAIIYYAESVTEGFTCLLTEIFLLIFHGAIMPQVEDRISSTSSNHFSFHANSQCPDLYKK